MSKSSILARSNIRKAKGQTIAIIVLVLLASVMMNLWLMLGTDYKANFKRTHDRLNDGHITLLFRTEDNVVDVLKGKLDNSPDVSEYCATDTVVQRYLFFDKDTALSRNVGKFEIVEEGEYTSGIYLPIIYKGDEPYQTQIGYEYKIGSNDEYFTYTVCGFVNSPMMGSDNCGMIGYLLTADKYDELCESRPYNKTSCVSIRLQDASQSLKFETEIKNAMLEQFPDMNFESNTYEMVSATRYISQSISAAIMCAMAFIIILIALVVISSNVVNYIKENMQNLGALKAVGYTSRQLISAQAAQFSWIALAASVVGIALSYTFFPYVADMMNAQTGIPYKVRFLPIPCLITAASIVGAIALAVYLSARSVKKIEPITALRQGISTHSFRKNYVPLDKTKMTPNTALAFKTTLSGVKQNVTVCVTMLVLSLIMVFAGVMYKNVIETDKPLLDMILGETADYGVMIDKSNKDSFVSEMRDDSRIEKLYQFSGDSVLHKGGSELLLKYSDDPSQISNQKLIIEGRLPKYANEVAVGAKYARDKGLKIGGEITLSYEGESAVYLITGYTQYMNILGEDCLLTNDGFEKLTDFRSIVYYINLKDGTDIDAFDEEIRERFGNKILTTDKIQRYVDEGLGVYTSLVTVIVIVILVLSALIILFVLYLLVKMLLNNKKRDYGILKALGYTTSQLVLQTALSFMPPIVISTAVGVAASTFAVNPLISLFLGGIGVVKSTFEVSVLFNVIAGTGLILVAFGAACLLSLRVRKIAPRNMLSGE